MSWGYPVQQRGVTWFPGLYFLGMNLLTAVSRGSFSALARCGAHRHAYRRDCAVSPTPHVIDTPPLRPALSPPVSTFDFIVIGSGPAGRRASIQAAKLCRSVFVVEKGRRVGGVSVHIGTIPSKTLRETVLNLTGWRERGFFVLQLLTPEAITAAIGTAMPSASR